MRVEGEALWVVICIRSPRPHRNSEKIDWLRWWPVAQQRSLFIWRANDLMSTLQTWSWCGQHPGSTKLREIRTVSWIAFRLKAGLVCLPLVDKESYCFFHLIQIRLQAMKSWWIKVIIISKSCIHDFSSRSNFSVLVSHNKWMAKRPQAFQYDKNSWLLKFI